MKAHRLRLLASFVLFAIGSFVVAEEPFREPLTPEQLQQALLRMKGDILTGSLPKMSPDALKKLVDSPKLAEFAKQFDQMKDNPLLQKMLKDQGIATPPQLAQDPRTMQSIRDALTRMLPPTAVPPTPKNDQPMPRPDPSAQFPETDTPIPQNEIPPGDTAGPKPFTDLIRGMNGKNRPLTPEEQRRERTARGLAKTWERIVGPIDDNPALRKALMDMVLAGEDLKGADGSDLWKFLEENAGRESGQDFGEFLKGLDGLGGDWKLPKLDLSGLDFSGWNLGGSNSSGGSPASRSSSSSSFSFGSGWFGGNSWLPVVLFIAIAVGALIAWRFWPAPTEAAGTFAGSHVRGPWPVDPRNLASRQDVIQAFEYLTLLRCGEESRSWNHLTIALTLGNLAADETAAGDVARLYAKARYAPATDEFSPADLANARRQICHLAGVPSV